MSEVFCAIPTIYNGARFRSRLEARWAAFFDLLKWEWHYEPFDLPGWIPDFILHGKNEQVLVEVKPVRHNEDCLFIETSDKIEKSGWDGETLVVSYFLPRDDIAGDIGVGWLHETFKDGLKKSFCCSCAPFQITDSFIISAGFCSGTQSFHDRITGYYPGGRTGANNEEIDRLWACAGNTVQWRGQR